MSDPVETPPPKMPTKMPFIKRVIILVRGNGGVGMLAVGVAVVLFLLLALGALSFTSGVAVGVKRHKQNETVLQTEIASQRKAYEKLQEKHTALKKELADSKSVQDAQALDAKVLRDEVERLRIEKQALDKVLSTVQERLFGAAGKAGTAAGPLSKCDGKGGPLRSKEDLECLNLRQAIEAMNSRGKPAEAPATKPAEPPKPAAAPAPRGH